MVQKSYHKNYLKIYFWSGTSILLNILSMFIVVPYISNNQAVFGVYSVCISTAIFLSYADLGFLSAGYKYAGESYARRDVEEETKLFGFASFILFVFVSLIVVAYLMFAYNPSILIKNIADPSNLQIASKLLFIQAIFSYNIILSRFVSGVFIVRIENDIIQRLLIFGSVVKLCSIFYFFSSTKYDIVGYFFFLNLIAVIINIAGLIIIKLRYNYALISFVKSIKFDKRIFKKTKQLAFASLFSTLIWILYYELDIIAVGKILGATSVAIFSVAFTFMKFFRSLSGIIFGPFQARYNHLVGLKDYEGLRSMILKVIQVTMPVVVFPILSIILLSKNIIFSWVGEEYNQSILILMLLAINALFMFITVPTANLIVSLEKIRSMYGIGIVKVLIFWLGVLFTVKYLGVYSFPAFKLISNMVTLLLYTKLLIDFLDIKLRKLFNKTILKMIVPVFFQMLILLFLTNFIPESKGKINFVITITIGGFSAVVGFLSLYVLSKDYKLQMNNYLSKVFVRG